MSSGGSRHSCPPGQIKRVAYDKKGHERKSYSRKSYSRGSKRIPSTKVKGSFVSKTHVPETCVKDRGAPGKGPKTLPPLGDEISLRKFGYDTDKSMSDRHKSLDKAAKAHSYYKVLKRLNLAANYQADEKAKNAMRSDVNYLSKKYAEHKEKEGRTLSRSKGSRK